GPGSGHRRRPEAADPGQARRGFQQVVLVDAAGRIRARPAAVAPPFSPPITRARLRLMPRVITVGAAQLGPIARRDSRSDVVKRLVRLRGQGDTRGCDLVVFPELALTTFFPRWWMEDQAEI